MRAKEFLSELLDRPLPIKWEEEPGYVRAYFDVNGKIKTIVNHQVRNDILLLVDWWEHAWILDYGSDKKKYLKEQWKIINWNVINTRWGKSL